MILQTWSGQKKYGGKSSGRSLLPKPSYFGTWRETFQYLCMFLNEDIIMKCCTGKRVCKMQLVVQKQLTNAVSNNICNVCFGQRYEYTDKRFTAIIRHICRRWVWSQSKKQIIIEETCRHCNANVVIKKQKIYWTHFSTESTVVWVWV